MTNAPPRSFDERCADFGIELDIAERDALARYLALLLDTNTRTNLTAIRDPEDAWIKHIFDALTLIPVLSQLPEGSEIIDIGSGGGLPGIPLSISMPSMRFTLVDATKKKTDFLAHTIDALGLKNATTINARAESLGQDRGTKTPEGRSGGTRERFDAATARAVGKVAMIAELTIPLVKPGGLVVLTKGQRADDELNEAKKALHLLHTHHAGTIDTPTGRIVVLEKQRPTPKLYPRRDGEPKRRPLGTEP